MTKYRLAIPLAFALFFSGCSTAKFIGDAAEAGLARAKKYITENVIPELKAKAGELADAAKDKAIAYADSKLAEQETKQLAKLDAVLERFAVVDEITGVVTTGKTWKDFDADADGHLGPGELAKVEFFVLKSTALAVAKGEMTKDEGIETVKTASITALILGSVFGGTALLGRARRKKNGQSAPAAPAGGTSA